MPLIDRKPVEALAHCGAQLDDSGAVALDDTGRPFGNERCEGYAQQKVPAVLEVISWTYADRGDDSGSLQSRGIENSSERLEFADDADRACPFCGSPRELSLQVRPQYASLGGQRGGPDQLFADRRARRVQTEAQQAAASAAERQAVALERLANGAAGAEVEQLRAQVAQLSAIVAELGNGNQPRVADSPEQRPGDVKPRTPRRRSPA